MARMRKKLGAVLLSAAALSLTLTACGVVVAAPKPAAAAPKAAPSTPATPPATSATGCGTPTSCRRTKPAPTSSSGNPNINVKITQYGWDDYWGKLTNGFVAGDAPDVFTDHLAKYPEFVSQEQLVPLDDTLTRTGSTPTSTRKGWRTCGGPGRQALRPAEGLRHRRRSSTTRSWSPTRASKKPTCRISSGTPTTAARTRR